jgi:hypothetical protein
MSATAPSQRCNDANCCHPPSAIGGDGSSCSRECARVLMAQRVVTHVLRRWTCASPPCWIAAMRRGRAALCAAAMITACSSSAAHPGADASSPVVHDAAHKLPTTPDGATACGDVSSSSACGACAYAQCCQEYTACQADGRCSALLACADLCGEDGACVTGCQNQYAGGVGSYDSYSSCRTRSCGSQCAAPSDAGHGDGATGSACGLMFPSSCPTACLAAQCCPETDTCLQDPDCARLMQCVLNTCGGIPDASTCTNTCAAGASEALLKEIYNALNCWVGCGCG